MSDSMTHWIIAQSGSSVHGISQVKNWKWKWSEVAQSCPTLRDPMDCSLPGSSVHGIFQARVLEWGAIALGCHFLLQVLFPTQGSNSCLLHWQVGSLSMSHRESPNYNTTIYLKTLNLIERNTFLFFFLILFYF